MESGARLVAGAALSCVDGVKTFPYDANANGAEARYFGEINLPSSQAKVSSGLSQRYVKASLHCPPGRGTSEVKRNGGGA